MDLRRDDVRHGGLEEDRECRPAPWVVAVPHGVEDSRDPCSCYCGGDGGAVAVDHHRTDPGGNAAAAGVVLVHRDNRREEIRRGVDSPAVHGTDRRSHCPGANGATVVTGVDCRNDRSGRSGAAADCANGSDRDHGGPAEVKESRKDCGRDDGCCVRASGSVRGLCRNREEARVVRDRHRWGRRKTC